MNKARAALYNAIMVGQQHSPANSEHASALIDAFAANVRGEAKTALLRLHTQYLDSAHCQHDGEPWPCPTLRVLDATAEPGDRL